MDTGCAFCNKDNIKKQGIIYEDGLCYVIINEYPISKGNILVITKRHYRDIIDAPNKLILHLTLIVKKYAIEIKNIFKPNGLKIIMNVGDAEEIPHLHIHIIPLYIGTEEPLILTSYKSRRKITESERTEVITSFKNYEAGKHKTY
ncbi:MAG: HIT family protein [Candidatus Micrarchaeia archaeon]